jgi:calcium/calmodulin-dependent protein kinase I
VKIINKKLIERSHIFVQLLQNELQILGEKSHPNLIRIVDLIEDDIYIYVVSELAQGGELFDRLAQANRFTEA